MPSGQHRTGLGRKSRPPAVLRRLAAKRGLSGGRLRISHDRRTRLPGFPFPLIASIVNGRLDLARGPSGPQDIPCVSAARRRFFRSSAAASRARAESPPQSRLAPNLSYVTDRSRLGREAKSRGGGKKNETAGRGNSVYSHTPRRLIAVKLFPAFSASWNRSRLPLR